MHLHDKHDHNKEEHVCDGACKALGDLALKLAEAILDHAGDKAIAASLAGMAIHPSEIVDLGCAKALCESIKLDSISTKSAREHMQNTIGKLGEMLDGTWRRLNGGLGSVRLTLVVRDK